MFGSLFGRRSPDKTLPHVYKTAEIYVAMRKKILGLNNEKSEPVDKTKAIAFLMEMGLEGAVVTLVSYSDGGASMYFSGGGGIIGAGELPHPEARAASLNLIAAAPSFLSLMNKTIEFPLPLLGNTRFYIVMPDGVFTSEAITTDLANKKHQMWPLFYLSDGLITQIRLVDEAKMKQGKQP